MTTRHRLYGHPDTREVCVPVATVWTSPEAPRDIDAAAVADLPDMAAWTAELDAEGTMERRHGLHGRTLTQLLLGEPAVVLEQRGEWARVAALYQGSSAHEEGYPGWVRTAHLGTPVERTGGPTAFVTRPGATVKCADGRRLEVSCATGWWTDGVTDEEVTVLLPGGQTGTVRRDDVRLAHEGERASYGPAELLDTARQFLGLRYLWGGTSAWGLDCSGLVHLTFRAHRALVPRDAFDQEAAPEVRPVSLDEVRPGDLYFFARPGQKVYHVGFATRPVGPDGSRWMLHAPESGNQHVIDEPIPADRMDVLVGAGRVISTHDDGRFSHD
jgi:cell wall-associated NlpC family hydrolase